jgi:signal transduction histidine kinase
MTFSFKLTVWYGFVFITASVALLAAVYYLLDDSIEKDWRVTRSNIVAEWSGEPDGIVNNVAVTAQRAVIEGTVPVDLNVGLHLRRAFYKVALPALIVGLALGWFVSHYGLRPLRRLDQTVRHILATGKTSARVPVDSEGGEMNALVGLFNQMLDKNEKLVTAMHESLDNVAHDLRTPMTRLRGSAESALRKAEDTSACREALQDCLEESDRVLTMLTVLMDVAEAETGAMPLNREDVKLRELAAQVIEVYELVAEESGVTVVADIPEGVSVHADPTRLRQVLSNLVDNAIKYSREGQRVTLSARALDRYTELSVTDEGVGIPPGEQSKIWDRLYRGDLSRSQRGLGLGLSLVKAVVEAHGGAVSVHSQVHKGSCFTLRFPRS